MEIVEKQKKVEKMVRILVGKTEFGYSGLKKPIMTLTLTGASVKEIFDKIKKMLIEELKNGK